MKIFSKFKDYYDHVQGLGVGDDVNYMRQTVTYCRKAYGYGKQPWFKLENNDYIPVEMEHPIGISGTMFSKIYFCGKIYYTIEVQGELKSEFIYSPNRYKQWNDGLDKSHRYKLSPYNLKKEMEFLSLNGQKDGDDFNKKFNSPVILVKEDYRYPPHSGDILYNIVNPRLYEIEFQKVVDPYTAFMEIDMFISGVLGKSGGEMVTISDKIKVDKHGFDPQYGFRKRPKEKA